MKGSLCNENLSEYPYNIVLVTTKAMCGVVRLWMNGSSYDVLKLIIKWLVWTAVGDVGGCYTICPFWFGSGKNIVWSGKSQGNVREKSGNFKLA